MNNKRFLQKILFSQNNIKFKDIVSLIESLGFSLDRISGSHHIFKHEDIPILINLQRVKGEVKPYQVRQLLKIIEYYNLEFKN